MSTFTQFSFFRSQRNGHEDVKKEKRLKSVEEKKKKREKKRLKSVEEKRKKKHQTSPYISSVKDSKAKQSR